MVWGGMGIGDSRVCKLLTREPLPPLIVSSARCARCLYGVEQRCAAMPGKQVRLMRGGGALAVAPGSAR